MCVCGYSIQTQIGMQALLKKKVKVPSFRLSVGTYAKVTPILEVYSAYEHYSLNVLPTATVFYSPLVANDFKN